MKKFSLALLFINIFNILSDETKMVCDGDSCKVVSVKSESPKSNSNAHSSDRIKELTNDNFDKEIKNIKGVAVVDFFATWCNPCKAMKPIFDELANEKKDWHFFVVDVDKAERIAAKCGINAMPTFVIFKDGIQWGSIEGGRTKEQLIEKVKEIIAKDKPNVEKSNKSQATALSNLFTSISTKDIEGVKKAIAAGEDVNQTVSMGAQKISPLHAAVLGGPDELVVILINAGAKPSPEFESDIKTMAKSIETSFERIEKSYNYAKEKIAGLKDKKEVKVSRDQKAAQEILMNLQNVDTLKKMLKSGANPNTIISMGGIETTPLFIAIAMGNNEIMDAFIEAGGSLDVKFKQPDGSEKSVNDYMKESGNISKDIDKRLKVALKK